MSEQTYSAGDCVIYSFAPGVRARGSLTEILCEVVDPTPFLDSEMDRGRRRLRVRCIEDRDPMKGHEFIPFLERLRRAVDVAEALEHRSTEG